MKVTADLKRRCQKALVYIGSDPDVQLYVEYAPILQPRGVRKSCPALVGDYGHIRGLIHACIDDQEVQIYLYNEAEVTPLMDECLVTYPGLAPMSVSFGCPSCESSQVTAQATVLVATGQIVEELDDTRTCLDCEYEWEV